MTTLRSKLLTDFTNALTRTHNGVVACAARVEEGAVVEFRVTESGLPDEVERLMREQPRKQLQRRR